MSAAEGVLSGDAIKEYPGKLTPFVAVTCIIAAMGGLAFGYDIGISGTTFISLIVKTQKQLIV